MPIKSTLYVKITSGVIGASSVKTQELTGRRFSTSPLAPAGSIVTVLPGGAAEYFGAGSNEAKFASQYFGYISPAPASQANNLQFAAYSPTARVPRIYGGVNTTPLSRLQEITAGALSVYLGDDIISVTGLSFLEATSFADIASSIQVAIRAMSQPQATSAVVTYDAVGKRFLIQGSIAQPAKAEYVPTIDPANDVGLLMGLGKPDAVESPGTEDQTPLEAFIAAEQVTDSFGSASFESLTLDQAIELVAYVSEQNVKYQLYVSVSRSDSQAWSEALISTPSVGLILNARTGEWKESLPMAIMAATDYQRRNATVNYMFRQAPLSFDVNTTAEALALNDLRVNYYGNTASAGQQIRFFQRGFLMGGATAPLDMNIHANEQWFKAYLAAQLLNLQLVLNKIPANDDGRGYILAQLIDGINLAKFNGTISVGKTLTTAQKVAVTQLTGDSDAWQAVQTNGFWCDVAIVPVVQTSGAAEYVAKYTIAYSANDVVRTIEGSHNLV